MQSETETMRACVLYDVARMEVRDVPRPAHVAPLPFIPTRYYRG